MKNLLFVCLLAVGVAGCNKSSSSSGGAAGVCNDQQVSDYNEEIVGPAKRGDVSATVSGCDRFFYKHSSSLSCTSGNEKGGTMDVGSEARRICAEAKRLKGQSTERTSPTETPRTESSERGSSTRVCSSSLIEDMKELGVAADRSDIDGIVRVCHRLIAGGRYVCVINPRAPDVTYETNEIVTKCEKIVSSNK